MKTTAAAGALSSMGAALLAQNQMLPTGENSPTGKKGQGYPDERHKYTDSKSGKVVWQLTNMPEGRIASYSYYNVPKVTPDGRWAVYCSDRASEKAGRLELFKMDLRTGESVQLTDTANLEDRDNWVLTPDGKEIYFFDMQKNLRVVDMESFKERKVAQLAPTVHDPLHNSSVSPDKRFVLTSRMLEPDSLYTYLSDIAVHHALIAINTQNGQMHNVVEGMFPIGINEYCPTNPDLILWDVHGGWEEVHRPWIIHADGTGNRPVMMTIKGEGSGHQFWSWDGRSLYTVISGAGRYPQGLWTCNLDGSNERCVLAGGSHAHAAASPHDDVFVADEIYGNTDALYFTKKGNGIKPEVLCQTVGWFQERPARPGELSGPNDKRRVIGPTPYHPHSRFTPDGTKVAYSNKSPKGGGNIYMVEI
jgi:oligogalacturonide lyase